MTPFVCLRTWGIRVYIGIGTIPSSVFFPTSLMLGSPVGCPLILTAFASFTPWRFAQVTQDAMSNPSSGLGKYERKLRRRKTRIGSVNITLTLASPTFTPVIRKRQPRRIGELSNMARITTTHN